MIQSVLSPTLSLHLPTLLSLGSLSLCLLAQACAHTQAKYTALKNPVSSLGWESSK